MIEQGSLTRQTQKQNTITVRQRSKNANEQTTSNAYITQAAAEAARVAVQTMCLAGTARTKDAGPRMCGPIMKQPTFSWNSEDKYAELKTSN